MEIRKVPISLLNAAPYNPRKDLQPGDPEYQKIARSIEKYGWFDDGNQKAHINQFRKDLIEQRLSAVRTVTEGRGLELTDKTLLYGARASLCATICKQKYTRAVGSQE